ncbi:peptidyl-prolyl cis-trans isomerase sig-7 [Lucilia sericata]|uniref:peptidyl-prolyl cis-trans isomerase sig-7 n=1 Tax=Lucilia sericata TaxID=13632 RepID=UPI0018A86918|nr:peptidyl-prolyl cis-trans isomerase sig-7 [Lucilia sericata]
MSVVIETTIGDITVDLFTEERPVACLNFMKLCKLKYYNYNLFHTIEQGFIAQTGDPTGAGDGGSSIWGVVEGQHKRFFEAESLPKIHHTTAGLLSLVGAGKHLVGSQFFFTLGENLTSLDGQHCVIGEVVEGHEVLRQLNESIVDEKFRPYQDIRITHTVILEDPFPDPRGFREPSRSPSPSAERLKNGRIAADEDIDDTDGKTMEEIQEMLAEREAKARATILEIVGDLPDAEMAPPENVLFVCKLNPVTNDDDLEIIFSRFGKVKGCEVIRDRKTGDSLQYAFVEFEEQKSCEAAYFKMDNVLIDDRRIHVDFSQSVSKVKWRGKGRGIEGDSKGLDFNNLREKGEKRNGDKRRDYEERNFNSARNRERGQRDQHKRLSRSRSHERQRMSSAERRKAREERHREQEKQRRKSRSRSRNRSLERSDRREKDRNYNHRSEKQEKLRRRSRSRSRNQSNERSSRRDMDRSHYNRSENGKRDEKYLPNKRYNERTRYSPEPSYTRHRSPDQRQTHKPTLERKRAQSSPEHNKENGPKTSKKHKKQEHKKKSKKSKHDTSSSDEDTSADSDTSSESSETSSSESDSSSEEERRKKKKSKKSKQKKNKSKKSKTKKHKK